MNIDIVGAGIGGLSTAIALQQKGIQVRLFEQATALKPVGAGIIIANNGMQVFEKLGLRKEIETKGNYISSMNITDSQLKAISSVSLKYFEDKYGVQNTAIHRGKLQEVLVNQLSSTSLYLGHKLVDAQRSSNGFQLDFGNKKQINSELLIGADGLNSTVRTKLFGKGAIRNSYQVCWRGIASFSLPTSMQKELNEAWGFGARFGFVKIDAQRVYWYAVKSFKAAIDEFNEEISSYFEKYHPLIKELIQLTPKETIHRALLEDLKPIKKWWQPQVCLLGDAAHAMTPNLGQGACQGIEDAYLLAECLAKYKPNEAFAKYQSLRLPKAHHVVKTSWRIGKMAHWESPLSAKLRNTMMRGIPQSLSRKQSERIFSLGIV